MEKVVITKNQFRRFQKHIQQNWKAENVPVVAGRQLKCFFWTIGFHFLFFLSNFHQMTIDSFLFFVNFKVSD